MHVSTGQYAPHRNHSVTRLMHLVTGTLTSGQFQTPLFNVTNLSPGILSFNSPLCFPQFYTHIRYSLVSFNGTYFLSLAHTAPYLAIILVLCVSLPFPKFLFSEMHTSSTASCRKQVHVLVINVLCGSIKSCCNAECLLRLISLSVNTHYGLSPHALVLEVQLERRVYGSNGSKYSTGCFLNLIC